MRAITRGLVIGAVTLAAIVGSGLTATWVWPDTSARTMLTAYAISAGLELKSAETAVGPIGYFEGGSGPTTVVLLHGLFSRKEHWIDFSRQLSDGYRVIIPDLPGFGDNPVLPDGDYTYAKQEQNVQAFLDAIGVDRFHLAGNSMGGQIAGQLAVDLPERVMTVAFIGSPVGIDTRDKSRFEVAMARDGYTLVVTNQDEYDQRNNLLFPEKPFVPGVIEHYWENREIAQAAVNRRIWQEVNDSNDRPLEQIAPRIDQQSLVVWCRDDEIFDFSGAEVLADALAHSTLVALNKCGHIPSLDSPKASGQAFRAFLDSN